MDFQVYGIILIVFLVSFLSYLFISKFLPHGKSFDEMIAEKKRMREEVLGVAKPVASKQTSAGNKKKPKKEVKKRESKAAKEVTSNESDASESSEAVRSEPATPPETLVLRKNTPKVQQHLQPAAKKGKGKGGILVNKNEPVLIKEKPVEEEVNHFAEIQPKDDVEIHRSAVKEEVEKKHFRDTKKSKPVKVETPPISPKNQPIKEVKPVEEKPAKKKRNEQSLSAVDGASQSASDGNGITPVIKEITRADLTKNQIQILIDFLLNKQSDTLARDPTEWSEGKSDLVQKLKKQLQDKEAQIKNEQDALVGMQSKLKELRSELNTEKMQFNANLKLHSEHLQNSRLEIKNLQTEIQFLTDKHNTEKQNMSVSFKQLQTQCMQMKETLKSQEGLPNVQQLQGENQLLQQEVAKKSQQLSAIIEENRQKEEQLKKLSSDSENKVGEFDVLLRKKDERYAIVENELRQRVQELASRDNEIQKLNAEATRAKEFEKVVQRQTFELEQLKQNNHVDESNKIEIRNLQNALDSSKKELESQRTLVADFKAKVEDLNKQLTESKQLTNSKSSGDSFLLNEKMNELMANHQSVLGQKDKQLADYQKQVESLQQAESELTKLIEEQKAKNNTHPTFDVASVKELFTQHFPEAAPSTATDGDGSKWLESALKNLKSQIVSNKSSSSNTSASSPIANNVTNNNHLNIRSEVEKNNLNNSAVNGGDSTAAANELMLLQNAQLKTTVEEYKNIIAETESMLKNLESKVREQDAYWTKVCLMKDNEIESLKSVTEKS